jgi:hypothetical protein
MDRRCRQRVETPRANTRRDTSLEWLKPASALFVNSKFSEQRRINCAAVGARA